ncbi:hypothetical protein CZ809_04051 [Photobacterium piscicola]|uniref:RiboL-PSP-HEPN domain-containing protein n=1 Tax=Photobacterium piscicola TaxID=1378299 RepID=A0A1T5I5V9_9GAMM|nr:MAE_28990/MAE_18760 family HEPN-like nuclease [Photobacterium piscicola]SKC34431.1 hypothetical protein CZ809_04051 [Photobacterium piscicola]
MTLEELIIRLETEKEWREKDIRFFHNLQEKMEKQNDKERLRRSIIGMFYAHIEGFVGFSFNLYAESINDLNLKCKDVKPAIAVATLNNEFIALKNKDRKNDLFKRPFPDDTKLHQRCREMDFYSSFNDVQNKKVKIPRGYISTESNIGPDVLRKILYQMGMDHNILKEIDNDLLSLLNKRNDISHGKNKDGVKDDDYNKSKECYTLIFNRISTLITNSFSNECFLADK